MPTDSGWPYGADPQTAVVLTYIGAFALGIAVGGVACALV